MQPMTLFGIQFTLALAAWCVLAFRAVAPSQVSSAGERLERTAATPATAPRGICTPWHLPLPLTRATLPPDAR